MVTKLIDIMDTQVCMCILIDDLESLGVMTDVIVTIGKERCVYELYKDDITAYMIEIRMPYNRYFRMMGELIKRGYNLRPESNVNIFNRLYKER